MKVLVTGATGFIGSELTRQLLAQGREVRILRRAASRLDLLGEAARHVDHAVGDVTEPHSLLKSMEGVRQVYHAAAYVGVGGHRDQALLHRVNVVGTANVVNAALKTDIERLVHTSSIAALGRPEQRDTRIDETIPWHSSRLNTAYAISKHNAELEIHRGIAEGLDAVMVNPSLVFGVGRPGENTRQIVEKVRDGRLPAIPTGGTNAVDVQDVAAGHLRAMERGKTGERYMLSSENLSWKTLIETLAGALGVSPPRFTLSPGAALAFASLSEGMAFVLRRPPRFTREIARQTARSYTYDNRKAVAELGCSFRPFAATAARIAEAIG
ncbi:MAG: SDR family oxidoreductase [Rhodothermales bacterium]